MYLPIEYIYTQMAAWILWYVILPIVSMWLLYKLYRKVQPKKYFNIKLYSDTYDPNRKLLIVQNVSGYNLGFVRHHLTSAGFGIIQPIMDWSAGLEQLYVVEGELYNELVKSQNRIVLMFQDEILNSKTEVHLDVKWQTVDIDDNILSDL